MTYFCLISLLYQGQVVYNAYEDHVVTQGPVGTFPRQADSGLLEGQIVTAGTHWNPPGIVMVTLSGAPAAVPGHVGGGNFAVQSVPLDAQGTESQVVMMYAANAGCVFTQGSPGYPLATSVQAGEGVDAALSINSENQGSHSQWVMVPVSLAAGDQPQLVGISPAEAMTTDFQPLQADFPPSYEQDQEMTQQNEQVWCV